jgi:CRP/FNR family cyclic AMP-dependent transcriptional regulator
MKMKSKKDEMIGTLMAALNARSSGKEDILSLPRWDASSWSFLLSDAEILEVKDGEVVIRKGDASSDLYFLVKGRLEVSVPQSNSISMSPLISIGPGSVVGELTFLDERDRSASVWSSGASSLLRLRRSAFFDFQKAHPELACDLLMAIGRILAGRLRRAQGAPKGRSGDVGAGVAA